MTKRFIVLFLKQYLSFHGMFIFQMSLVSPTVLEPESKQTGVMGYPQKFSEKNYTTKKNSK